ACLSSRAADGNVLAWRLIKPKPAGKLACQGMLTLDEQGLSGHVGPRDVAEIDRDEAGDLSAKYEIDLVPGILDAHIDARSIKQQPHDAVFGAAGRHA